MANLLGSDIIDSRDIIARIDELESERQTLLNAIEEANAIDCGPEDSEEYQEKMEALGEAIENAQEALETWENEPEYTELKTLADEAEGYADDWRHGATLIEESYFTEYAEELCKDIGDIPKEIPSYIVIDWEATAENLKADYTEIEAGGYTYLVR